MTGLEGAALALGAAVVKSAARLWLGDRAIVTDLAGQTVDLLADRSGNALAQRRTRRLVEQMEEIVAERLGPLIEREFPALPENEELAAIAAVRETFDRAALTDDDITAADLDPTRIFRTLVAQFPDIPRRAALSADGTAMYERLLRDCCAYLVQITLALPRFPATALTDVLRRETEILDLVRDVLARLPQQRRAGDFEAEYRTRVISVLDRLEFFGATLSEANRRYPLSVAYISLTAAPERAVEPDDDTGEMPGAAPVFAQRIEELIGTTARLLIRGDAGSGKTTLLQWIAVRAATGDLPVEHGADLIPFLIRLRRFASRPFPPPEEFLDDVASQIAEERPQGWVHQQLRSGRSVVLIDGVDELPPQRREDARRWLRELISAFPAARYVVTSRPSVVDATWLRAEDFRTADLQPMSPATYVPSWIGGTPRCAPNRSTTRNAIGSRPTDGAF